MTRRAHVLRALLATVVALLIAAHARDAHAEGWADQRVVGPFVCRADFPLRDIEPLLDELARLQDDLTRYLGIRPAAEPIELYLFSNETSYRRYLQHYFPTMPYRRALYFKEGGPGRVLVHRSSQFQVDIRHECTHALLHAAMSVVPLWLDEGLAEYFELPAEQRVYDNPYLGGLRWNARLGMIPNLERLEKQDDFAKLDRNHYRDSWAWVHFMLHGSSDAHDELVRYLTDLQAGTPPGLLSQRLVHRLPYLNRKFASHLKSWKRPTSVAERGIWERLGILDK